LPPDTDPDEESGASSPSAPILEGLLEISWLCHYNLSPFKAIVNDEMKHLWGPVMLTLHPVEHLPAN